MPKFFAATGSWNTFSTASNFPAAPWHFILGVATFAFLFNFVDMANWQSLAANRNLKEGELRSVSRGLALSAGVQLLAPAFVGCWLGVVLKGLKSDLADDQYFNYAFSSSFDQNLLSAIMLGLVLFGLLGITISSAGSYLLASMQTLAVDVVWREKLRNPSEPKEVLEKIILRWTRHNLMLLSLGSICVFAGLYYSLSKFGVQGLAFQFQFVMYGVVVTLFPCVVEGLLALRANRASRISSYSAHLSIVSGLIVVIVPFIVAATVWDLPAVDSFRSKLGLTIGGDAIINLTPVFGFLIATLVCVLSIKLEERHALRS
jgi:hypothetical protein